MLTLCRPQQGLLTHQRLSHQAVLQAKIPAAKVMGSHSKMFQVQRNMAASTSCSHEHLSLLRVGPKTQVFSGVSYSFPTNYKDAQENCRVYPPLILKWSPTTFDPTTFETFLFQVSSPVMRVCINQKWSLSKPNCTWDIQISGKNGGTVSTASKAVLKKKQKPSWVTFRPSPKWKINLKVKNPRKSPHKKKKEFLHLVISPAFVTSKLQKAGCQSLDDSRIHPGSHVVDPIMPSQVKVVYFIHLRCRISPHRLTWNSCQVKLHFWHSLAHSFGHRKASHEVET